MMRRPSFRSSWLRMMGRLFVWAWALIRYQCGNLWDTLRRRGTEAARAGRLRLLFEEMGGTAVKIGQQMSLRVDLLPYAYCAELSKMLDRVAPFPAKEAIKTIERLTGGPLEDTFSAFDPEPIGSASVACVYHGVLRSGEHVAIKVRRPGIGEIFAADCGALGWVLRLVEFFTFVRPGLSRNFLFEFRTMLFEELDFVKEARYTELFRRAADKADLDYVTTPRVYFELSGEDVLVTEYVSGLWLTEIMAALDHGDPRSLHVLKELRIEPARVARNLLRINQFSVFENLLFHADPHPANILVREDGKIVLIDFGSCGYYTRRERRAWRQVFHAHAQEDVAGMVNGMLALVEPLPPIDVDEFSKRVELGFWQVVCALKSKHAEWWERTSVGLWINFLDFVREYEIPMNLNTLRILRATLLYETVAARLHPTLNPLREYRRYRREAGKRARKRLRRAISTATRRDERWNIYLQLEQGLELGNRIVERVERLLDVPQFRFVIAIGKAAFAVAHLFRMLLVVAAVIATATGGILLYRIAILHDRNVDLLGIAGRVASSKAFIAWVGLLTCLQVRRILFRVRDKDVG